MTSGAPAPFGVSEHRRQGAFASGERHQLGMARGARSLDEYRRPPNSDSRLRESHRRSCAKLGFHQLEEIRANSALSVFRSNV